MPSAIVNTKAETLNTKSKETPVQILGSPLPDEVPWNEAPFPAYWVNHFPSSITTPPGFMAVAYGENQKPRWLEQFDDQDAALSKALDATRLEQCGQAVVYRYMYSLGKSNASSPSQDAILIDGYFELTPYGLATWVGAIEVSDRTPRDKQE